VVGFRLPDSVPTGSAGTVRLGVYRTEGEFSFEADTRTVIDLPVTSLPGAPGDIALHQMAVLDPVALAEPPDFADLSPLALDFGSLALRGVDLPAESAPGEPLTLTFGWAATADLTADMHLFVHLALDADSVPAAQFDGPPLSDLPTATWPPGFAARGVITLTAPDVPGTYSVYIGLYDPLTENRLPVAAPDNRPLIGEVVVNE
jgi:hypothetical protein